MQCPCSCLITCHVALCWPAGVNTCVEVEGHNVCTVRAPHETVSLPFNWVAGPATTQSEFFKGKAQLQQVQSNCVT
jgi:hypothetical protein